MAKRKSAFIEKPAYQRPFLKYAGCKFELLDYLLPLLVGSRLVEPFAGSCVVGLNAPDLPVWANDLNPDLINLYRHINDPEFLNTCRSLFNPARNNEASYMSMRGLFNANCLKPLDRAAVFVYLNRHCYNGLCRYNSDGGFNVSFGRYDEPRFPCLEIGKFQKFAARKVDDRGAVTFTCLDFCDVMDGAQPGDVVYCDPPYLPVSDTADFVGYAGIPFGHTEAAKLNEKAVALMNRGIPVVISNSNTVATHALFSGATRAIEVMARRRISRDPATRGIAKEVILVYQP